MGASVPPTSTTARASSTTCLNLAAESKSTYLRRPPSPPDSEDSPGPGRSMSTRPSASAAANDAMNAAIACTEPTLGCFSDASSSVAARATTVVASASAAFSPPSASQFHRSTSASAGSASPAALRAAAAAATCSPYPAILCATFDSRRYRVSAKTLTLSAPHAKRKSFSVRISPNVAGIEPAPSRRDDLGADAAPPSDSARSNAAARATSVRRCLRFPGASLDRNRSRYADNIARTAAICRPVSVAPCAPCTASTRLCASSNTTTAPSRRMPSDSRVSFCNTDAYGAKTKSARGSARRAA